MKGVGRHRHVGKEEVLRHSHDLQRSAFELKFVMFKSIDTYVYARWICHQKLAALTYMKLSLGRF